MVPSMLTWSTFPVRWLWAIAAPFEVLLIFPCLRIAKLIARNYGPGTPNFKMQSITHDTFLAESVGLPGGLNLQPHLPSRLKFINLRFDFAGVSADESGSVPAKK